MVDYDDDDDYEFETYSKHKKRIRRRYFLTALVLGLAVGAYFAIRPKHRGRVVRDPSRVESVAFPASCVATLGRDANRVRVRLLSVKPVTDVAGLRAALAVEVCNPTEADLVLPGLRVRYAPKDAGATGFSWDVGRHEIGSGFCDEFVVESPPLGELVTFRSSNGVIEAQGLDSASVLVLPDCRAPTPKPTLRPPPPPTQRPSEAPPPTSTAGPEPTPLAELDVTSGKARQTTGVIREVDCRCLKTDILTANYDGLVLLNLEKREATVEVETKVVVGSLPPEMLELRGHLTRIRAFMGRPVYVALVNQTETVYLFPVLGSKESGLQRYFVDTVETTASYDPGYRSQALKIPIKKGEMLHLEHFAIPVRHKDRVCMDTISIPYRVLLAPPLQPGAATTAPTPTPACADDAEEPNDSYQAARHLEAGSHELRLCAKYKKRELEKQRLPQGIEDVDWFTIAVPEDKSLGVTAAFDEADGNVDLRLYDEEGGRPLRSSLTITGSETLVTPPGPATFHLAVALFARDFQPSPSGVTYILRLTEQSPRWAPGEGARKGSR